MNFSVIINGKPRGFYGASRELRQGEMLSPFLFVLLVDGLSRLVERVKRINLIDCLSVGQDNVEVSHLQFANDTIFFSSSNEENI